MEQCIVEINSKQWVGYLAISSYELTSGLGGVESMPEGVCMLFDMGVERSTTVTTEEMLFPIDIIWISEDLTVVKVDAAVEPGQLITHTCRYFLEVNSGEAEGIVIDDSVNIWVAVQPISTLASIVTPLAALAVMSGVTAPMIAAAASSLSGSKKAKKEKPSAARIVTVPGGSHWHCVYCGRELQPKEKAVKVGSDVICDECVRKGRIPHRSIPTEDKIRLSRLYGTWAVGLAEAMSPEGDVRSVERIARELLIKRGILVK